TLASTVATTNGDVVTSGGQLIQLTGGGGTSVGSAPAGTVLTNSGTWCDTTAGATFTTFTATTGSFAYTTNGTTPTANGTWSWQGSGTGLVTITATDSFGSSTSIQFWLNVGEVSSVNTNTDTSAVNALVGAQDSNGNISLRSAIQAVNAAKSSTPALIAFGITGSGPFTIQPQPSQLDPIQYPVFIDGFTQPGSEPNTLPLMGAGAGDNAYWNIILDGSLSGGDGLAITAGASTVQGLAIQNFGSDIHLTTYGNDVIAGN